MPQKDINDDPSFNNLARLRPAPLPGALRCSLRVFWWAKNRQGRWVEVSHAPVELPFPDAAALRGQLEQFSRTENWGLVVAAKPDLAMHIVLYQRSSSLDFDTALACFCEKLRARGRSRFELHLHELFTAHGPELCGGRREQEPPIPEDKQARSSPRVHPTSPVACS